MVYFVAGDYELVGDRHVVRKSIGFALRARGGSHHLNLPFDEWTETFGSERLTGALHDRLTHHVHILEMNGESFRLNHSRARKPPRRLIVAPS